MRILRILKREYNNQMGKISSYFKERFFLTSTFFKYYKYMKVYNIVKTLDINTLTYSHSIDEGGLFATKNQFFIINKKYVICDYKWSVGSGSSIRLYVSDKNDMFIEEPLKWLEERKFIDDFHKKVESIKFEEKIYKKSDDIPSLVRLKRFDKINKILS